MVRELHTKKGKWQHTISRAQRMAPSRSQEGAPVGVVLSGGQNVRLDVSYWMRQSQTAEAAVVVVGALEFLSESRCLSLAWVGEEEVSKGRNSPHLRVALARPWRTTWLPPLVLAPCPLSRAEVLPWC